MLISRQHHMGNILAVAMQQWHGSRKRGNIIMRRCSSCSSCSILNKLRQTIQRYSASAILHVVLQCTVVLLFMLLLLDMAQSRRGGGCNKSRQYLGDCFLTLYLVKVGRQTTDKGGGVGKKKRKDRILEKWNRTR